MIEARALDFVVIIGYFVTIVSLGVLFGRFSKTTQDFFFGGNRFPWWMIAISCVATVVGSYSFIKYSSVGYQFGLSSSMTYLNDWFIVPIFVLVWLPIIYFNRIRSIPEYFHKRFDEKTKILAVIIILTYMIGYVGINFYTLGVALQPILKINLYYIVVVIAILGAIYLHAGGQTSVIITDIIQGFVLMGAGFILFVLCLDKVETFSNFWENIPYEHRFPFTSFNKPTEFNFVGIFWQDAIATSTAFWFMSQGTIMRFLSAKSVQDGRKAMFAVILVLMPLASFALTNAGWFGRAMVGLGILEEPSAPGEKTKFIRDIFVNVAFIVSRPGIFGFVLAALTAALMSTIDTLINAVSAIFVNDIYRPYIKRKEKDEHYLHVAKMSAIAVAVIGVLLVPVFEGYKSIYAAHGVFNATVTPPMVIVILLSVLWKRFTTQAAFYTLLLGSFFMAIIPYFDVVFITPLRSISGSILPGPVDQGLASLFNTVFYWLSHGVSGEGGFKFIRAFFGLSFCLIAAVVISCFTKPKTDKELKGLVIDSLDEAKRSFKGSAPNDHEFGKKITVQLKFSQQEGAQISKEDLKEIASQKKDMIHISDERWYSLYSLHTFVSSSHDEAGQIWIEKREAKEAGFSDGQKVLLEKII